MRVCVTVRTLKSMRSVLAAALAVSASGGACGDASHFAFLPTAGGYSVCLGGGWSVAQPLAVETVFADGRAVWTLGTSAHIDAASGRANGTVATPGGATIAFADAWADVGAGGGDSAARLRRTVAVVAAPGGGGEIAFSTRLAVAAPAALAGAARRLFVPGVAYSDAAALPAGALAGDPLAAHILVREDRLPLPFALAHFAGAGAARVVHAAPAGTGGTLPDEDGTARIVDSRLQFGSVGFLNAPPAFSLAFQFPGSEGNRTYVSPAGGGWANRSHPLAADVSHAYELVFRWQASANASYAEAATRAWREEFSAAAPRVPVPTPAPALLYRAGMDLLAEVSAVYNGVPSVPFEVALNGSVVDTSSQMGFVGRALPSAALLLYDAVVVAPNATRRAAAEAVVDLWAAQAPTTCGVVRTWYNINAAGGSITWRASDAYQGSLRIQSDGMSGMLAAWRVVPQPAWLAAAVRYADFLVRVQAADGSLAAAYDWSCAPLSADVRQTPHSIPFLVAAHAATHDDRYSAAALAAGTFAAALFADCFSYSGGAVDNPDVPDKEGGWLAAQAFIALYSMTGDEAWLAPAAQAATYAETFTYAWDVPIPCLQTPPTVYPCRRTTLGASIIATGQSGADSYMSCASFDFKRLGGWLRDEHFTAFGAFLEQATPQVTNWDGSLGYAAPGFMTEATTMSVRRGAGVAAWLPWLTANLLTPIVQSMQEQEHAANES